MGMKGKTWLVFCVLFLVFFMGANSTVWAQENMCVVPTGTESVAYPVNWESTVVLSMGVDLGSLEEGSLPRGHCVEIWVDSGGWGKPTYTLQLDLTYGDDFYFDTEGGPSQTATAHRDFEKIELCAGSNACGSAIVTMEDSIGTYGSGGLKVKSYGVWGNNQFVGVRCEYGGNPLHNDCSNYACMGGGPNCENADPPDQYSGIFKYDEFAQGCTCNGTARWVVWDQGLQWYRLAVEGEYPPGIPSPEMEVGMMDCPHPAHRCIHLACWRKIWKCE